MAGESEANALVSQLRADLSAALDSEASVRGLLETEAAARMLAESSPRIVEVEKIVERMVPAAPEPMPEWEAVIHRSGADNSMVGFSLKAKVPDKGGA